MVFEVFEINCVIICVIATTGKEVKLNGVLSCEQFTEIGDFSDTILPKFENEIKQYFNRHKQAQHARLYELAKVHKKPDVINSEVLSSEPK